MPQQFDQPQNQTPPTVAAFASAETTAPLGGDPAFSALSQQGQKMVADYLAHVERGLASRASTGKRFSALEQAETLHELQSHLLSLVTAYQELGDDEQTAISAAIAQFGRARSVSGGLRRAQTRSRWKGWMSDGLLPAVLVPTVVFAAAVLLPFAATQTTVIHGTSGHATTITKTAFGWELSLLLPLLAGIINAKVGKKWALPGLFIGNALVLSVLILLDPLTGNMVFHDAVQAMLRGISVACLAGAGLGLALMRGAKAFVRKKQAT